MIRLRLRLYEMYEIGVFFFAKVIASVFPKHGWVIHERGTDARDNGYWFYKYVKETYPQIKVYYLIDKKSPDYSKVKEDAVQYGGWKHYWVLARAEKIISTHYGMSLPICGNKIMLFCGLHKRFYFLQHGVTKDDMLYLFSPAASMRMFVCGAKPEADYIRERFGHPSGVVQYTGFARFDKLHDAKTKKQILVMPTWRMYIHNEEEFFRSSYYRNWMQFLTNVELHKWLEENEYDLVFYVHYEMQKYINNFCVNSDRIIVASFEDFNVQVLLKESAVLVTDYSSVFFDFAYMKKPMVYFMFDEEEFFGQHYQRGYFDYHTMGFGDVCKTDKEVINSINRIADNNFALDAEYEKHIAVFFPLHDQNNCKRIFDFIAGDIP